MKQMKTFVFDADGVVCVGAPFSRALEREYKIPAWRLAEFFAGPFPDCIVGRRDLKEAVALHLSAWGWPGSVEDLLAFWFRSEYSVCPRIIDCVRTLRRRGHGCVLGTNQEKYRTAYLSREMGLDGEFDRIFASCELGAAKPEEAFFRGIEGHLAWRPSDFYLIDDNEKNVVGARSAGWEAIHYKGADDIAKIMEAAEVDS